MIGKRTFDLIISFIGLFILSPLMLVISLFILVIDQRPIFFIQTRVGQFGRSFDLYKYRTMVEHADKLAGGSVTVKNDPRITKIGKFLRKWKLDELPTLFNVFKGDMSFVGPRPDVPGYTDKLKGSDKRILGLRPGITGPATLKYSNEEQLLANADDPIKYNDEIIFPDKVRINLEYLDSRNFLTDIIIILKTIFRKNY